MTTDMSGINRRMPHLTYRVGAPDSMARKAQLMDELVKQIPDLIEKAKDEKIYIYESVRNNYLDGVIDQLEDILEYIRINNK